VTIEAIRRTVLAGDWAMTRHARERAGKRRIGDEGLVHALANGEILGAYGEDPRGPSALLLGHDEDGRPLHAVCAFDPSGTIVVITVYEPELPNWVDERTRGRSGGEKQW
jgi:hypothetical protein